MKFKNLLSLKYLIIIGFVIAVIPLFLGVMYAAGAMRDLAALDRAINYQVFEQTKTIRSVLQKASDIERKARLFILLSDPSLRQPYERESYETMRASFKEALAGLLKLRVDNKIALLVNELEQKEELIYQQIIGSAAENNPGLPIDEAFQSLREAANILSNEFENHVNQQFNELRRHSRELEQSLLTKGEFLLLVSVLFITALLVVLSRSMRQLDAAIRRLGSGELVEPITVTGPEDLRYLGDRLEWLREHLMELEVSKQTFIANVAHEIEAPLKSLREGAELLANETADEAPEIRQDIARLLCVNTEKLQKVSGELARYSQASVKPDARQETRIAIIDLLDAVIADFQTLIEAKSISLKKLLRPVAIIGVPGQLRDIIGQLLANAVKFSPENGEIRIMLRESGGQMELEIEDEGPGIAPEERPRVFEPFFRGQTAGIGDAPEGAGLGLAIVKDYVANHQGKVDVMDTREDQHGTRIRVRIPITETD